VLNTSNTRNEKTRQPGRLKKRPEFLCVAKQGQKWVSDSVILQAMPTDADAPRFGYTATKKIGNAVTRNRAKRRLRAAIQDITQRHTIHAADIVLIARHNTVTTSWDALIKNITWCLKRLEILE